ncbi:glycoside hydrolase family 25 protein [Flavobacterium aquicola]|uniref:GH25 family lysozyme M1 (1,4-beta-N-acetylmuramidase) n=1 Tax=Flavobacterium aquicola TaxID=1682742 RepID=A0A3E0DWL4_9FLAO|nr:glycoside hydrolase family 25 protein [Flavobacterium aquicola]REG90454.1 GH25 family lysozyme M1 (1,4-beta-N-acetylmuramidase) [Flavobacterium aquicola]
MEVQQQFKIIQERRPLVKMSQLKVIVNKLNKRTEPISKFVDKSNIIGTVSKGYMFEGTKQISNALGDWFEDRDGYYYWGGGLLTLDIPLGTTVQVPDLPINLPNPYRVGIDVSHHNTIPSWQEIKNCGVTSVYIKLSEGVGTPDIMAIKNATSAKQLALNIGYYHFCRPDTRNGGTVSNDAEAEADEVFRLMAGAPKPNLPLVLDLENAPNWDTPLKKEDYRDWINIFINRIEDKCNMECMIYSRKEYLDRKLPHDHDLGKYKLWISRYTLRDCNKVELPVGWNNWAMWQYRDDGIIGTNGKLDINIIKDKSLF